MQGFWDDIDLMRTVTRIFAWVAAGLLLVALVGWLLQRPYFAITRFNFVGDVGQLDTNQMQKMMEEHLQNDLAGGFFSMNLHRVQDSLQQFGWVKSTSVRRVWPHEIEIGITAYQPFALWKDRYLSPEGQIFNVRLSAAQRTQMLTAEGPEVASALIAEQIPHLQQKLAPLGWSVKKVSLSERYSWRVTLNNNLEIELGRADTPSAIDERIDRLNGSAKFVQENTGSGGYIDLRYPNGFAMRTDKLHRSATEKQPTRVNDHE